MKEIKFTVYEFSELSDKAKQRAIEEFPHETDWIDTYCIQESIREDAKELGITDVEIGSARSIHYDYISGEILAKDCEKIFGFKPDDDGVPFRDDETLSFSMRQGYLTDSERHDYYRWLADDDSEDKMWDVLKNLLRSADEMFRQKEEWLFAEERVIEEYRVMQSLFHADGKLYQF